MKLHDPAALGLFSAYVGLSLGFLYVFNFAYMWLTPYDEREDIAANKMPAAISLAGAMIGFTVPLVTASYVSQGLLGFVEWAVICGAVQLLFSRLMFIWLPADIHPTNESGAVVYAGGCLAVGLINAFAIIP